MWIHSFVFAFIILPSIVLPTCLLAISAERESMEMRRAE